MASPVGFGRTRSVGDGAKTLVSDLHHRVLSNSSFPILFRTLKRLKVSHKSRRNTHASHEFRSFTHYSSLINSIFADFKQS